MLLDLLQAPPPAASAARGMASSVTSLQEELSFSEILTSSLPEASSSMPLLHTLQESTDGGANDAFNIHTHQPSSDSLSLPFYHSNFLYHNKYESAPSMHQRNHHKIQVAELYAHVTCMRSCHGGTETLAWPLLSPCHEANDASKSSTSTATSEPSSTLENMDACEIAPVQESHWQLSDIRTGDMQRIKDATQHSCQTSLDEGSSMQESLPCVTMSEDACRTGTCPTDEGCSFDDCSARNASNLAGADDCAIVSRPAARKRKRTRAGCKNSEEVESQRMTHIAVERNRRRQMNEHLNVLRSLMPSTYIQRGDQASIIGGAIDFVKELEHVLQALQTQKDHRDSNFMGSCYQQEGSSIFEKLVKKEQFIHNMQYGNGCSSDDESIHVTCEGVDVDVRLIGTSALVKVLAQKLPQQLLKVALSIESFHLRIMHLNITTIDKSVLYSFNLEVQGDSQFKSANVIAHLVQSIFRTEN